MLRKERRCRPAGRHRLPLVPRLSGAMSARLAARSWYRDPPSLPLGSGRGVFVRPGTGAWLLASGSRFARSVGKAALGRRREQRKRSVDLPKIYLTNILGLTARHTPQRLDQGQKRLPNPGRRGIGHLTPRPRAASMPPPCARPYPINPRTRKCGAR